MKIQITYTEVVTREQVIEVEMTKKEYQEYLKMSEFDKEQKYDLCASTSDMHHVSTESLPISAEIITEFNAAPTEPQNIIEIPRIGNYAMFERQQEKAYEEGLDHCPCCGKAIKNPTYYFNSIYGGAAYPANDKNQYPDAWVMGVGSECMKKFPKGYIFKINN